MRLRTCSPSHNGAEHHWGFELCCAFYLKLSLCIFFWLKSLSKAYCESLFSLLLNHFIALTIKHQNIFMKTKIFFFLIICPIYNLSFLSHFIIIRISYKILIILFSTDSTK